MFKWHIIALSIVLAGLIGFCAFHFSKVTPSDEAAYLELIKLSDSSRASQNGPAYTIQQEKTGIGKDVFFIKGTDRLQCCLKSEKSELRVDHQNGSSEIVEYLQQVKCLMQEELIPGITPKQIVRSILASKATYHYQTDQLVAEDVTITRSLAAGHEIKDPMPDEVVMMNGTCTSATFSPVEKNIYLNAINLKASFLNPEKIEIESGKADYREKEVILSDNAIAQHPLGRMSAKQITILAPLLTMEGHVLINLKDGSMLTCDQADINYAGLKGSFYSIEPGEVVYTDNKLSGQPTHSQSVPLVIRSRQMDMEMQERPTANLKSERAMSKVLAQGNVVVNYNEAFTATADQALYQRPTGETSASSQFPGLITLRMNENQDFCTITHRNGDKILAKNITIDTLNRRLVFNQSKGLIANRLEDNNGTLEFFADHLIWEDIPLLLTLNGDVLIDQQGMGNLRTNHEVKIQQHILKDKKEVKTILCTQDTTLSYIDTKKKDNHTLTCHGQLNIDHEYVKTMMDSPRDQNGKVLKDQQICFKDRFGIAYADKATIDYKHADQKIELEKIVLEGNVKLFNYHKKQGHENEAFQQYALADIATYLPGTYEMKLSSQKEHRVLFFDDVNHLQISAPALKIQRDKTTQKDSVQGIGDVRFNFIENEFAQLKELLDFKSDK